MLTYVVVSLNQLANFCGRLLLAPVAWLPGWLSATLTATITGVLMLLAFKITSNQAAIKRTRNQIKANLLALSLFKDSVAVALRAQGRMIVSGTNLLLFSIVPMLVMTVPMCLTLAQLAIWYQARPLRVGEEAVVTAHVNPDAIELLSRVSLELPQGVELTVGPVRVPAEGMVCWKLKANKPGMHEICSVVDGQRFDKEFAVGEGFLPVSQRRPAWRWSDALMHPREPPLSPDAALQSIDVDFPERSSWTSGTDTWMIYWFVVSLIAAFAIRPVLRVNL